MKPEGDPSDRGGGLPGYWKRMDRDLRRTVLLMLGVVAIVLLVLLAVHLVRGEPAHAAGAARHAPACVAG